MTARTALCLTVYLLAMAEALPAQRLFPDDPLKNELTPLDTADPKFRSLSPVLEYFSQTFTAPGEHHPESGVIPAMDVNTVGEPLNGAWYFSRHASKRMTEEELQRGPGENVPPSFDAPWGALTVKMQGFRPGIYVEDAANHRYLLRFDPRGHLEMTTAAEVIGSKLMYALGYWTPENYIVYFDRHQLRVSEEGFEIDSMGERRNLLPADIDEFLSEIPSDPQKGYRAVATRVPDGVPLGPFQYYGRRSDDPNDLFPHEHRRTVRGLFVFDSWIDNIAGNAVNSLDVLTQEEIEGRNIRFIRHYLVDFSESLGSALRRQKDAREGNDPMFSWDSTVRNFAQFGIFSSPWMKAKYPNLPAVGRFESETFRPEEWSPSYLPTPFVNRLPDDEFWAAKVLMTLSDDDIRTIVRTGQYSDPAAEKWIADTLIARRDKIGRYYFSKILPLDNFRFEGDLLVFDDLAAKYGFGSPGPYEIFWSTFDNVRDTALSISGASGPRPPEQAFSGKVGDYFKAEIVGKDQGAKVACYVRREGSGFQVAGLEYVWPDKVVAQPGRERSRRPDTSYSQLTDEQRTLFLTNAKAYTEQTGFNLTPEQYWSSLSVSERTTFDAVTHALQHTKLTTQAGESPGTALDLVESVDRIAGQYYGRSGDEQFRVYVKLRPGARETLEKSREFFRDKDNTVYHVGYPISYRQTGKPPTIQFSMTEAGDSGDIDVDYRSSKLPKAMWNGHTTSANSDVRAGKNYEAHKQRWAGLAAWWQGLFGGMGEEKSALLDLFDRQPPIPPLNLPPDRPAEASPDKIEDAAQEFLTDWLQRGEYQQALDFVSDSSLGCIGRNQDIEVVVNSPEDGRRVLEKLLESLRDKLDRPDNLAQAIEGVEPWRKNIFKIVDHPYRQAFSVFSASDSEAQQYLCKPDPPLAPAVEQARAQIMPGSYHGVMFRFRFGPEGGTLALVWAKQNGRWMIMSWDVIQN